MSGSHVKPRQTERDLALTLILTTIAFVLILGGSLLFVRQLPYLRERSLAAAVERGDLDRARQLIGKISDAELARSYQSECDYIEGRNRMDLGDWSGARSLLAGTGDYRDAAGLVKECDYQAALTLEQEENWAEAARAFRDLGSYQDSAQQYDRCRYALALSLEEEGQLADAATLFRELGDYLDSGERLQNLALSLTGLDDPEEALASLQGLSREDLESMSALAAIRESLPKDSLAVGFYHTLGLRRDGHVLACGDDSFGQCQTGTWTDVKAVAAGAYHSLGLRADGTVYSVGRADEGQCATEDWTDIIQIAASDYASFGLRRDGTILVSGLNDYPGIYDWMDIETLRGGSYGLAALRSDGTILTEPGIPAAQELSSLVDLDISSGYAVGLRADGRVRATAFELESWKNIVAISAGTTGVLGLNADGSVCAFFFRPGDAPDMSQLGNVTALAAGGSHWAFTHEDGSVTVLGDGSRGQADTESWKLTD